MRKPSIVLQELRTEKTFYGGGATSISDGIFNFITLQLVVQRKKLCPKSRRQRNRRCFKFTQFKLMRKRKKDPKWKPKYDIERTQRFLQHNITKSIWCDMPIKERKIIEMKNVLFSGWLSLGAKLGDFNTKNRDLRHLHFLILWNLKQLPLLKCYCLEIWQRA